MIDLLVHRLSRSNEVKRFAQNLDLIVKIRTTREPFLKNLCALKEVSVARKGRVKITVLPFRKTIQRIVSVRV